LKTATGATPLHALDAISLDTETTGLDPASARIVQLGTVNISRSTVIRESGWERIVNPGIDIPPASTEIHGIDDEQAQRALPLVQLWPEFIDKIRHGVMIGHTIGFDLTVLEMEAAREHLDWIRPRALCVRMLAMLLAPGLASHSLDALASWLKVKIENRHDALGDAIAAAQIFSLLVPRLAEIGIKTLAEAERSCLSLTPEIHRHQNAGWQLPVTRPGLDRLAISASSFDSTAYRHTVSEIMTAPAAVIQSQATLKQAIDLMMSRGFSSVFVAEKAAPEQDIGNYGILTERDALRCLSRTGAGALEMKVDALASRPVQTIRQTAFIYRAAGRMSRMHFRHLGVVDDDNRLVGAISARDLLRARTSPVIILDDTIEGAISAIELAEAWATLPAMTAILLDDHLESNLICRIISEEIRSMTRRATILAQKKLGTPPCAYTVLVLGSAGRGESLLVPDQDNAVIFESGEPDSETDKWFAELGAIMADILHAAGIPYCKGGVMARNAAWRGSVETWYQRIDNWLVRSRPEDLLNVDIFFDAYPVHGEISFGRKLFEYAYQKGHKNQLFTKLLGESLSTLRDPFTFFGAIRPDSNGGFNLKSHALFPIATLARTLAIRHNIVRHSTSARIENLVGLNIGGMTDLQRLSEAHSLALSLLLANQSRDIEAGLKPSNLVDLAALDRSQMSKLKNALRQIQSVSRLVRDLMFAGSN
jgi:CBS domain-containing protein